MRLCNMKEIVPFNRSVPEFMKKRRQRERKKEGKKPDKSVIWTYLANSSNQKKKLCVFMCICASV